MDHDPAQGPARPSGANAGANIRHAPGGLWRSVAVGRIGPRRRSGAAESPAKTKEARHLAGLLESCRRRDSNPRHADYDSYSWSRRTPSARWERADLAGVSYTSLRPLGTARNRAGPLRRGPRRGPGFARRWTPTGTRFPSAAPELAGSTRATARSIRPPSSRPANCSSLRGRPRRPLRPSAVARLRRAVRRTLPVLVVSARSERRPELRRRPDQAHGDDSGCRWSLGR